MRGLPILTAVLAFLPLTAGAQQPRLSLKEAELLVPREIRKPVKSMIPGNNPTVHDTLDTSDPAIKIVLCNDGTWHYSRDLSAMADSAVFRCQPLILFDFLLQFVEDRRAEEFSQGHLQTVAQLLDHIDAQFLSPLVQHAVNG